MRAIHPLIFAYSRGIPAIAARVSMFYLSAAPWRVRPLVVDIATGVHVDSARGRARG